MIFAHSTRTRGSAGGDKAVGEREAEHTAARTWHTVGIGPSSGGAVLSGRGLSDVRLHSDTTSAGLARALRTPAFTVGSDIGLDPDALDWNSPRGSRVLAHELAHVRQNAHGVPGPAVRCFEGPEHQDLGDRDLGALATYLGTPDGRAWAVRSGLDPDELLTRIKADPVAAGALIARVDPVTGRPSGRALTVGQIISLQGDFYERPEDLARAPEREVSDILAIMADERRGKAGNADKRFNTATGGRYLELAARNDSHFAPLNREMWRTLHQQALAKARTAGQNGQEADYQAALFLDSAAGHYLTDAFAAGHVIDGRQVLAAIARYLQARPIVARRPAMQLYLAGIDFAGKLPGLVLKNIHDHLNQVGFTVVNARGMRWHAYGDRHLKDSPDTSRIAALAVFLSREQLRAAREGRETDPAEVESLLPNEQSIDAATLTAIRYISHAVADVEQLVYEGRSLAPEAFGTVPGAIIRSNLDVVGDPSREQSIERDIEAARRRGSGPVVEPSFTVGRW